MWNLFRKKELINVIFWDGTRDKLSHELTYLCSQLVINGIELHQTIDFVQNEKMTSQERSDFFDLIFNGVELSTAIDIIRHVMENRENEKIVYKNNDIIMHGLKDNGELIDIFILEEYKFLDVNNEIVIDIGSNIGDSAIYFALNGAKKIIALEPYPYSFDLMETNVRENNLLDKIEMVCAGYGKDGEISIDENVKNNMGTSLKSSGKGRKVKVYSLESLIKKFNLDKGVLKIDCEGCEYHILREDNSVIARFSQIQIEYHNGYKKLVKKLNSAGFQVKHVNRSGLMNFGYIYAKRL